MKWPAYWDVGFNVRRKVNSFMFAVDVCLLAVKHWLNMPLKIISITVTEDENTKLLLEIIAEYYYAP